MNKKLVSVICSVGFALCVFTGCAADTTEAVIQALKLSSSVESESGDPKARLRQDPENKVRSGAYYFMMADIISRYRERTQTFQGIADARIEAILKDTPDKEYIAGLKAEYSDISARYRSLIQSFYADENYIALKNELDARISELAALIKGSPEYNLKLIEINAIWGQISMLAGEVNSEIITLDIRAAELSKEIQSLINAGTDFSEPAAAPASALSNAFWQELRLLQKTLAGLPQVAEEQGAAAAAGDSPFSNKS